MTSNTYSVCKSANTNQSLEGGANENQGWNAEDEVLLQSWFDDRVECRNALSKVAALSKFDGDLDRKELPWMEPDERPDNLRVYNLAAD